MGELKPLTRRPGRYVVEGRRDVRWEPLTRWIPHARSIHQYPETAREEVEVRSRREHLIAMGGLEVRVRCVVPAEGDEQHLPEEAPPRLCKACEQPLGPDRGPEDEFHTGCAVRATLRPDPRSKRRKPTIAELARLERAKG